VIPPLRRPGRRGYDPSGRVASYADAKGTTAYGYGAGDQLESVADPRNLTLKFDYDNLSRRTRRYALSGQHDR